MKFVESCFNESKGGFSDFPRGEPDVFTSAVGVMAVKELGMPLDKYRKPVAEYLGASAKTFDEIRIAAAGLERLEASKSVPVDYSEGIVAAASARPG